jgi:hypothetical protein
MLPMFQKQRTRGEGMRHCCVRCGWFRNVGMMRREIVKGRVVYSCKDCKAYYGHKWKPKDIPRLFAKERLLDVKK